MKYSVILKHKSRFLSIRYDISFAGKRLRGITNYKVIRSAVANENPLKLKVSRNFSKKEKLELEKELNEFDYFVEKAKIKNLNLLDPEKELQEEIDIYFSRTVEQQKDESLELDLSKQNIIISTQLNEVIQYLQKTLNLLGVEKKTNDPILLSEQLYEFIVQSKNLD